jgi:Asp-tRNA(Asn)/Glu-tRNA(Gln) amidotransferase A subunit family amidase
MARDVADTALLFSASIGPDPRDPLSYPVPAGAGWPLREVDLSKLRVGYTEDFGVCAVDQDIRRTFRERVEAIRPLVASCEPVDLQLGDPDRAFDVLRAESFVAAFADTLREAPETLGPNVRANLDIAAAITLADRAWAHLEQTRVSRRFADAFEKYDLLLAPVTPVSPFSWTELYASEVDGQKMRNYYQWLALTYVVTLATNPALSLPCGRDGQGMPFGLQVIGRLHQDVALLGAARALEQAFQGWRVRPDVGALKEPRPELKSIVTHPPVFGAAAEQGASNAV